MEAYMKRYGGGRKEIDVVDIDKGIGIKDNSLFVISGYATGNTGTVITIPSITSWISDYEFKVQYNDSGHAQRHLYIDIQINSQTKYGKIKLFDMEIKGSSSASTYGLPFGEYYSNVYDSSGYKEQLFNNASSNTNTYNKTITGLTCNGFLIRTVTGDRWSTYNGNYMTFKIEKLFLTNIKYE